MVSLIVMYAQSLGVVRRADLVDAFKAWVGQPDQAAAFGSELLRGCKAAELKALADAAMRMRGRTFQVEAMVNGEKVYALYKHCELA